VGCEGHQGDCDDFEGDGEAMTKAARSRRKLAMWSALPPYLGGKRRLCPLIFREIDRVLPRRLWAGLTFLDGFLGGGSVSLYAKAMGFRVISCDIADRAIVVGRGLIENSRVQITREDVIRILTPNPEPPLRVEREMSPAIFTKNVGRFIDRCLAQAGVTQDPAKAALFKMLAIRVALLEHPMSQIRPGTVHRVSTGEYESITESCVHHYVGGLRLTRLDRVWQIAEHINSGVFAGQAQVIQGSIFDVLPASKADVLYADPPYASVMSYEKEYRIVDEILEGTTRPTSPFTAKNGADVIDGLLERAAHVPLWLLSFGNAAVTLAELEEKMRRLGRATRAIEIKYQHLPSIATDAKKETNREYLVVGWDPAAALLMDLPTVADTTTQEAAV
jgi:adenine-specific DNA methylase